MQYILVHTLKSIFYLLAHLDSVTPLIPFRITEARISLRSEGLRALLTELIFNCIDFSKVPRSPLLKVTVECSQ